MLITDGYDEHSTRAVRRRAGARCERPARRSTSSASAASPASRQGRAAAAAARRRDRRPVLLPVARRAARPTCTTRSPTTCRTATCSPTRRRIRRPTARGARSRVQTADADDIIRARPGYFAPKPPPIRPRIEFTATDPSGALSRPVDGRSRGRRGRRRADARDVPGSRPARLDRARARRERQHEEERGGRHRERAGVRRARCRRRISWRS